MGDRVAIHQQRGRVGCPRCRPGCGRATPDRRVLGGPARTDLPFGAPDDRHRQPGRRRRWGGARPDRGDRLGRTHLRRGRRRRGRTCRHRRQRPRRLSDRARGGPTPAPGTTAPRRPAHGVSPSTTRTSPCSERPPLPSVPSAAPRSTSPGADSLQPTLARPTRPSYAVRERRRDPCSGPRRPTAGCIRRPLMTCWTRTTSTWLAASHAVPRKPAAIADDVGFPVAVKAAEPDVVHSHRPRPGAGRARQRRLEVASAVAWFREPSTDRRAPVLVQPMVDGGRAGARRGQRSVVSVHW